MSTFAELNSGMAQVCHVDHRCDQGVGTVWKIVLSDGYIIDCGHSRCAEARANVLASIINEGGAAQWQRFSGAALEDWRAS